MKKITILCALFAGNCSSLVVNQKAIRLGLSDGKVSLLSGRAEDIAKEGFLLELKPGDRLILTAGISGDFVFLEESNLNFTITRKCSLYSGHDGLFLSANGTDFHSLPDFFRGSMSLQLDLKKNAPIRVNWRGQLLNKAL